MVGAEATLSMDAFFKNLERWKKKNEKKKKEHRAEHRREGEIKRRA
jgi:hypothetical protein